MASKKSVALVICGVLGVVFLVAGCVLTHVFPQLIHDQVKDGIPLKNGSESYKLWKSPTSPIFFQVWMFHIVNHDEVLKGEEPAYLVQKGPYTYQEKREKFGIVFNENGTLNYREKRSFIYRRDMSVGSENDTFITVNLPLLTIMELTQNETDLFKKVANLALRASGERLFMNVSVYGMMWGYEEPLLKLINDLAKEFKLNVTIPDKFGLFLNKNGSDDGVYEIYSGQKGVENFAKIVTWNHQGNLAYWTSDIANMINGSDGTLYPPFVDTKEKKYLFSSDLCRSLGISYTNKVTVRGIDLDKFEAPPDTFANHTINPYNEGFCYPEGNCLPSGLLNVASCRDGAPIVMSMPHFLGCDPATINSVTGLDPNAKEHTSYIDIEPMTGVAMNVGKRLQINAYIHKIEDYEDTYNFKELFMPVMWLNESAKISGKDADKFKSEVLSKIDLTRAVQYGLIALGGFIIVCIAIVLIKTRICNKAKAEKVENVNSDDEPILNPVI